MCNCSQGKSSCCSSRNHNHYQSCCDSSCGCHCNCSNCCCAESSCDEDQDCHKKGHKLLEVADMAWIELLKEKIKEHIKAADPKLDELAKIVSEANHKRWKQKMQKEKCCEEHEQCCEDFENQLCKLFSCGDGSCHSGNKPK